MERDRRRSLAHRAMTGYDRGPDAPVRALAKALDQARSADRVVLVEGISDQMAIEALAGRVGRDLAAEGTVVVPIGGAQAITSSLRRFGPQGAGLAVAGLCDVGEEEVFRRGLARAGLGQPTDRDELGRCGFFVCQRDLEDELIRAAGPEAIEALLDSQGDLGSFRTLQKQPAWRDAAFDEQAHRWLRAGATRNLRYARLLVEVVDVDRAPRPLLDLLATI